MGENTARALGVDVTRTRAVALAAATLMVAFAVSAAGPISFVALVAPHIARRLCGSGSIVVAGLVGAVLLAGSDLVAQHAFGVPIPVGVVTIVLGGLFFVALLWREGRRG